MRGIRVVFYTWRETAAVIGGACGGGARHWSLGRGPVPPLGSLASQWRRTFRRHGHLRRHFTRLAISLIFLPIRLEFRKSWLHHVRHSRRRVHHFFHLYFFFGGLLLLLLLLMLFLSPPYRLSASGELVGIQTISSGFFQRQRKRQGRGGPLRFHLSLRAAEIGSTGSGWILLGLGTSIFWPSFSDSDLDRIHWGISLFLVLKVKFQTDFPSPFPRGGNGESALARCGW